MRLTLRALLAYLDDVLAPATLKDIGARITESAPAAATVARIQEVVRRRRIAAPELNGSGSAPDPNIVAEYLDNTLAADAVPALEKLCLESDMHLAEVASSHQILTAVLGEPIEVPITTRERMYALVSQAPLVDERPKTEAITTGTAGPVQSVAKAIEPVRIPITPDYLKPSTGRQLAMGLLAACLALGWLGWVLQDQGLLPSFRGQSVTSVEPSAAPDEPDAGSVSPLLPPSTSPHPERPAAVPPETDQTVAVASPGPNPAVFPAESVTPGAGEPVPPQPEPTEPVVAAPGAEGLTPPAEPGPAAAPAEVARKAFPAMLYVNAEGILLSRDGQTSQWNVMPRRALLHDGDEIATPDPFQTVFTVNGDLLEITLYGGTRVRLESGVGGELLVLSIDRGRVAVRRPLTGEHKDPVSIGLSLRGQLAELTLSEPGSHCGLEIRQRAPQGHRPDPLLVFPEGGISVVSGSVDLVWNGEPAVTIDSGNGWAAWPVSLSPLQVGPQRAIPNWLSPEGIPLTSADKRSQQMFEKEFAIDQPVSMSIPALVSDRREQISSLATYTLGLVDDVPMLVKALQSDYEVTRLAAIWSLRGWLPTDPNNTALLEMEVARIFADEDVSAVVELLWGYSTEDARDQTISRQLLAQMNHKQIAIRELAYFHVSQLTGRTNAHGYRASLPASARNAALIGWRNLLEKNGGQLLK